MAKALAEPLDTPYATTIAMETKGFGAPIEPTEIETLSARRVDYLWLLLIVAVFVICTVFKFTR